MYQDYLDEVFEVNEKIEKKLKLNEPIGELLKQSEECLKSLSVESRKLPGKERRLAAQDIKNLKLKVESYKRQELFGNKQGSSFLGQAGNNLRMSDAQVKKKSQGSTAKDDARNR